MPIVQECSEECCNVLTMGKFCLEHESDEALDVGRGHEVELVSALAEPVLPAA